MTLEDYQADLRRSYVGGGPRAIVSGLVGSAAAIMLAQSGVNAGFLTLFFGGMVIFPIATLICRMPHGRAKGVAVPIPRLAASHPARAWLLPAARPA